MRLLPTDAGGWRVLVENADAIVHVGLFSCLPILLDALSYAGARPRVLVTVSADDSETLAPEFVARAASQRLRVCCARLGAWVGEQRGLVRALVPLYTCFLGLRGLPDERPISWCHEYDVARALVFAIQSPEMKGPFDLVTPEPARVCDLDEALSEALGQRPILRTTLSTASRLVGERLARELARGSERVPDALVRHGFAFVFPDIRSAALDVLHERGSKRGSHG